MVSVRFRSHQSLPVREVTACAHTLWWIPKEVPVPGSTLVRRSSRVLSAHKIPHREDIYLFFFNLRKDNRVKKENITNYVRFKRYRGEYSELFPRHSLTYRLFSAGAAAIPRPFEFLITVVQPCVRFPGERRPRAARNVAGFPLRKGAGADRLLYAEPATTRSAPSAALARAFPDFRVFAPQRAEIGTRKFRFVSSLTWRVARQSGAGARL